MSDTSGPTSRRLLAHFAPEGSSLRTWMVTDLWGWTPFSGTLPRWGTWDGGALYELPMPALPTAESACSSSPPTLATPTAWLGRRHAHSKGNPDRWTNPARSNELSDQVAYLFPTPRATDGTKGGPNQRGSSGDLMLPSAVHRLSGASTSPPSADGNDCSDDLLHGLWPTDD